MTSTPTAANMGFHTSFFKGNYFSNGLKVVFCGYTRVVCIFQRLPYLRSGVRVIQ